MLHVEGGGGILGSFELIGTSNERPSSDETKGVKDSDSSPGVLTCFTNAKARSLVQVTFGKTSPVKCTRSSNSSTYSRVKPMYSSELKTRW